MFALGPLCGPVQLRSCRTKSNLKARDPIVALPAIDLRGSWQRLDGGLDNSRPNRLPDSSSPPRFPTRTDLDTCLIFDRHSLLDEVPPREKLQELLENKPKFESLS